MVLDKHAAVSGLAIVPNAGGAVAYVAEWSVGKVVRVSLNVVEDVTYSGKAESFIIGIANPVPVIAANGGSLLIGDWASGTVFRVSRLPS